MLNRNDWIHGLFPNGIPTLWCPPLTHFAADGSLDRARIKAHLAFMRPWVSALLVPGSTSEGWELKRSLEIELVDFVLACARELDYSILVGVLRTEPSAAAKDIRDAAGHIFGTGTLPTPEAFRERHLCGFAITAPRGRHRSQNEIRASLEEALAAGYPIALYQLPQITENEISPETVEALADKYPNLYMMKDTSGADRVVLSQRSFKDIFFVRGAEGNYARWYQKAGGPYHGFLLSSANCFPRELSAVLGQIEQGNIKEANLLSDRVSRVVLHLLDVAASLPFGNPFTNAAKAIDHFMAFGSRANLDAPIYLSSGKTLPRLLLEAAHAALVQEHLLPSKGYMEQ